MSRLSYRDALKTRRQSHATRVSAKDAPEPAPTLEEAPTLYPLPEKTLRTPPPPPPPPPPSPMFAGVLPSPHALHDEPPYLTIGEPLGLSTFMPENIKNESKTKEEEEEEEEEGTETGIEDGILSTYQRVAVSVVREFLKRSDKVTIEQVMQEVGWKVVQKLNCDPLTILKVPPELKINAVLLAAGSVYREDGIGISFFALS